MKKTQELSNYQHFLNVEFEKRRMRNPRYSLRAFARDLGVAAPKLSEILRGKCGLSEASAKRLAGKLSLSEYDTTIFVHQVLSKHARKKTDREAARNILETLKTQHSFDAMTLETFKVIADWYHFAILEMTEIKGFESDASWVAKRLHLPKLLVKDAIQRLKNVGLLAETAEGVWYQTEEILATPTDIPCTEINKNHCQILTKAYEALNDSVEERDFSSVTLAIPESQIDEIKKEIRDFRRKLAQKINEAENKDRVYCLSIQFFPLDHKE
jgi:uncharacterized protein (TIGR02147 family)